MSDSPGSFGPFELVARLGQGGMGEVWKARRRDAGADAPPVVVKRVLAHLSGDADVVHMFQREARLCARLDHPNVVRVLDFGAVGRELYLEMEYVDGVDLVRLMRPFQRKGLPPGAAAFTVAAIARALDYAHALLDDQRRPLRLVHRDVTPSNVMIAFDGQVKLLDFGIAKALSEASESHTTTGTLKGKFGYMAPEQVEGAQATHATDQFSLGVVLYEMLTGRRLFRGENDMQTIARVKAAIVAPPSHSSADVPEELDAICLRALERSPKRRFEDCAAFADALEEVAARLGWSAAQNARLVESVAPDLVDSMPGLVLALDREPRATERARPPATRRTRLRWRAALLAPILAVGAVVAWQLRRPAPPVVAPAPSVIVPSTVAPAVILPSVVLPPVIVPHAAPPSRAKPARSRIVREKPARARPSHPHPPAVTPASSKPATTGKVRAGQVLDPFAR